VDAEVSNYDGQLVRHSYRCIRISCCRRHSVTPHVETLRFLHPVRCARERGRREEFALREDVPTRAKINYRRQRVG